MPAEERGKSQWLGAGMGLSYRLSRAAHGVLTDPQISPRWSARARQAINSLRAEYAFLDAGHDVVIRNRQINATRWFTFAGGVINTALADAVRSCGVHEVSAGDFRVKMTDATGGRELVERARAIPTDGIIRSFIVSDEFIGKLKFSGCLPNRLMVLMTLMAQARRVP